jgi:hypothetical protein
MHGVIGVSKNRRGRKGKQRISMPGKPYQEPRMDYRAMAALQPHRVGLPERFRRYEEAGTVLGNLLLAGLLAPHTKTRAGYMPSTEARRLYEAGLNFAGVAGAYLASISSPRGTAGAGRGYDCLGCKVPETEDEIRESYAVCPCLRRRMDYTNAYDALARCLPDNPIGSRRVILIVKRVVVNDDPCTDEMRPWLVIGLRKLDEHFEGKGKRGH